jgi:hypothetical protein
MALNASISALPLTRYSSEVSLRIHCNGLNCPLTRDRRLPYNLVADVILYVILIPSRTSQRESLVVLPCIISGGMILADALMRACDTMYTRFREWRRHVGESLRDEEDEAHRHV